MANPQIVVEMDADEAKMWQKFKRLEAAEGGVENALKAIGRATKEVSKEHSALERDAKKVYESTRTPQERYNAELQRLHRHLKEGRINMDTFSRATKDAGDRMRDAGQAGETSFGTKALGAVVQYAAGLVSVSAALSQAVQMFRDLDQAAQDAFERLKSERAGMAELAGLAKTPEEAQGLIDTARAAFESGVGRSEDEAAGLHYKLMSTGLYDQRKVFEDLSRSGVIRDVVPTVAATARIQAALGEAETGDATAVMSKLYQASDVTQYNVEQIAGAAAEPALLAGKLGLSDEELLAQLSASMQTLDAAKAGTGARAFYQTLLEQGGFEGMSAADQIKKVQETLEPMTEEDRKKFFGRVEGRMFYESLITEQGRKTFEEQMVALPEAERTQLAITKSGLPDVDTGLRRARLAEQAKRERDELDRAKGNDRALTEMIIQDRVAYHKARGDDAMAWAVDKSQRTARWAFGDEAMIERAMEDPWALSERTRNEMARRLAETEARPQENRLSPDAQRQADMLEGGQATITAVVPEAGDPQLQQTNDLLEKINATIERKWPADSQYFAPRPMPASSSAANNLNRE